MSSINLSPLAKNNTWSGNNSFAAGVKEFDLYDEANPGGSHYLRIFVNQAASNGEIKFKFVDGSDDSVDQNFWGLKRNQGFFFGNGLNGTYPGSDGHINALGYHQDSRQIVGAVAYVNFTVAASINDDFNVSSITDNGAGDWTINIDVDLDNANYVPTGNAISSGALGNSRDIFFESLAVGSVNCQMPDGENNVSGVAVAIHGGF